MADILWPIPEPYLSQLQSIKMNQGIPISWIAVVPDYQLESHLFHYQRTRKQGNVASVRHYWHLDGCAGGYATGQRFEACGGGWAPKAPWVGGGIDRLQSMQSICRPCQAPGCANEH